MRDIELQEKKVEKERHEVLKEHANELKRQIKVRESEHINERNAFFAEAIKQKEEMRLRHQKLEQYKGKKLSELRYLLHLIYMYYFLAASCL